MNINAMKVFGKTSVSTLLNMIIYPTAPPLVFCHITNYHQQIVACKCNLEEIDGISEASLKCQVN